MIETNLESNEIIFLDFINNKDTTLYLSPYWNFDYEIDVNKTIDKFIECGYVIIKNDLYKSLNSLTIPNLKNILKNNNLKIGGNKTDLIERIINNIDNSYLQDNYGKYFFLLTSLGKNIIEENYLYIINRRKGFGFSQSEIENAYQKFPRKTYTDDDRVTYLLSLEEERQMPLLHTQKDCFNNLGVEKYKILATLDFETCPICAKMDLQEFDMENYQEGITAPPFHKGCRCCIVPSFEDEFEFGERVARDPVTNKTYYVPKNITYTQWKLSLNSNKAQKQKEE